MPRSVDLRPERFDVSHDPTNQMSTDIDIGKPGGPLDLLGQMITQFPIRVLETLLGIAEDPIPELANWVQNVPGLSQIVAALTGIPGTLAQLQQTFQNWRDFLAIDLNVEDFDPEAAAKQFVATVVQPFIKTLTEIRAALLGALPIGLLTDATPTMLLEGGFDDPITIIENGDGITHDATDGVPGTSPLGCAKVVCDGTAKRRATKVIEVGPGWVLSARMMIKYAALVAGADAIRLNILPYSSKDTPIVGGEVMVATAGTVSGTSGGVNGWGTYVSGTWTIPATGVTHVSLEWEVTGSATAGTVKLDNVDLFATQKIPQGFTKDLPEDLLSLWNGVGGLIDQMLTRLGLPVAGDFWDRVADLSEELEVIQDRAAQGVEDATQAITDLAALAGNLLHNPATVLGQLGQELIENLEDDLANADDAIADVFDDVRGGWTRFWNGIFKTPTDTTVRTAAEVEAAAASIKTAVDQAVNNTETLASTILLPRTKSLWESKWPQDDVSFPVFNIDGYTTPTLGRLYLIPVTASTDREYQSLKFAIQGTSMTSCYVGVYTIDTATGEAVLISNLGDVKSSLSGSVEQQSLALPASISAAKGQTFYVGVLQVGGTAAGMKRSSLTDTMTDYPTSHPQFFGNIVTGTLSSLPTTIAAANITVSTRFWAALGYGVSPPPPPKLYFADSFNTADGPLSSNWIARHKYNVGLVISANAVRTGDTGSGSHSAVPKFTTNNQGVRMTTTANNNGFPALFLRASNSMMVGFIYGSSASDKRIVTCPGYDIGDNDFSNCTTRATSSNPFPGTPASSYVTELTVVGNVYTAKWTNGNSGLVTVTWTDTGGIVPINAGQREAVIAIDFASSGGSFIDNFEMWDI